MTHIKILLLAVELATCGLCSSIAQAQSVSQTAPPPNRAITAPGPERHGPPAQPEPQLTGARAPQPISQLQANGNVEGFVYWDANKITHKPAGSCSGLSVTVSVGSNSGGPLTAYTPLRTLSNNFKYVGQVKEFMAGGKVNVYDVCTYGFNKVPVGPNLQVKLTVTDPYVFSPYALPQSGTLGPIQIVNGQCAMLPRITNPTTSDLLGHWGSCQNMAFDVNFPMAVPPRIGTGGAITPVNSTGQAGMLSAAPQQGMLSSHTTQSAPGQSSRMLMGGGQQIPSQTLTPSNPAGVQGRLAIPLRTVPASPSWPPSNNEGLIAGFVYWDTRDVQHNPPTGCSGLTVTALLGDGATPREQFQKLGAFSNVFTYLDHSPQNSKYVGFAPEWLGVCAYSISLPSAVLKTMRDVLIEASVNSSAFSPRVRIVPNAVTPVALSNHLCPVLDNPQMFYPGGEPESCDRMAFNIDFALQGPRGALKFAPSPTSKSLH